MRDANKTQPMVMTYTQARPRIKTGDLIAVRGTSGLFAQLIRWVTRSGYTHTGIAIWLVDENNERGLYVAEEDGTKNVYTPLSQYAEDAFDVFISPVWPKAQTRAIQSAMRSRIHYSWWQILRIGVYKLVRVALPGTQRGMVCSSFCAAIYRALGWRPVGLPNPPAPSDITAAAGMPVICVRVA